MKYLLSSTFVALLLIIFSTPILGQGDLYWADQGDGTISRKDLNADSEAEVLFSKSVVQYHVIDFATNTLYWSDDGNDEIMKANTDGSEESVFLENLTSPQGIALDDEGNLLYIDGDRILKADKSGEQISLVIGDLSAPRDITFHDGILYWTDTEDQNIQSVSIDGSGHKILLSGILRGTDIEINRSTSDLYWVQNTNGIPGSGLFTASKDGENMTLVKESFMNGIAVDGEENHIYWSEAIFNGIYRLDLDDSSEVEIIDQYLPFPSTITIDKVNDKIYFVDKDEAGIIFRADLATGFNWTQLIETKLHDPSELAVDLVEEKLYFISSVEYNLGKGSGGILRSNLDGSDTEKLLTYPEVNEPRDLFVDTLHRKMYWVEYEEGRIMSADLTGENMMVVVDGQENPINLTFDYATGKIFWSDWRLDKIQSANVDGSEVTDVIEMPIDVRTGQIAIYAKESKLYWITYEDATIHRSNLDGSEMESILVMESASSDKPNSLYFDSVNDKMYFSIGQWGDRIMRANPDGTEPENVLEEGFFEPSDIVLVNRQSSGLSDFSPKSEIVLFPNPVFDHLNLDSENLFQSLDVFNAVGQKVMSFKDVNSTNFEFSVAPLRSGVYFGLIGGEGIAEKFRFIKL